MNDQPHQRQGVPAYFHPACDVAEWARLASSGVALVVANIADGPGLFREEPWALALRDLRAAESHIVGYVDTGYLGLTGQRTRLGSTLIDAWIEQILHDIDSWYRMYDGLLTGIFFDQVAESEDGSSIVPVLRSLRQSVLRLDPDALTVLNAGASVPASFAGIADVLVTFEGPCEAYLAENNADAYEPLSWVPAPGQLIWHIVHHTTDSARAAEVLSKSRSRGADLLYMTDGDGDNPYSALPSPGIWATANSNAGTLPIPPPRLRRKLRKPGAMAPSSPVLSLIDSERELISNPRLIRDHDTIEASADFVVQSVCQRVFLASRRQDVPRWWTGSSPQIAADWLIENNRLYAYSGKGTDWTWTPAGQVIFEATGRRSRWCLEADVIGVGMDADADAAFHVSAPGNREYSEVAVGCLATAT